MVLYDTILYMYYSHHQKNGLRMSSFEVCCCRCTSKLKYSGPRGHRGDPLGQELHRSTTRRKSPVQGATHPKNVSHVEAIVFNGSIEWKVEHRGHLIMNHRSPLDAVLPFRRPQWRPMASETQGISPYFTKQKKRHHMAPHFEKGDLSRYH